MVIGLPVDASPKGLTTMLSRQHAASHHNLLCRSIPIREDIPRVHGRKRDYPLPFFNFIAKNRFAVRSPNMIFTLRRGNEGFDPSDGWN